MGKLISFIVLSVSVLSASAGTAGSDMFLSSDSVSRKPHVLREVEIRGVKNIAGASATDAVTRLSAAEVRRLDIAAVKNLGEIAPNFFMPDYGSRMTSSIYVRGLGARIDQPVVGLNVDNIPYLNKDGYDFEIPDIERIEIIRGASSVLNGRNTMGGQINIQTLSPMRVNGFRGMAEYASGNTLNVSAGYYGRLSHPLAMSLTGAYGRTDGFFRNVFDNSKVGAEQRGSVRWKTEYRPSERLSLINTAFFSHSTQDGYPYMSVESGMISYNDTCSYRRSAFADGLTVAWAGKRVVVTSLTSVQYMDDKMCLDQDFLPLSMFTLKQMRKEWTITEDLFTRGTRGDYSWLGGVFAFYRKTDMQAPVTFKDDGISSLIENHRNEINPDYPIHWDTREFTLGSDFDLGVSGVALYHESVYDFDRWRFEAGLRCDVEFSTIAYRSFCNTGYETMHRLENGVERPFSHTDVKIDDRDRLSKTFAEVLPKLTVSYDAGAVRPYLSFTKGYKAGGFNTQMFSDVLQQRIMQMMGISSLYTLDEIVSYEPESSLNYEIGAKSEWLDGSLKIDATAFFIDCRNQQLTVFPPGTTTGRVMTNAGRTFSAGAELSVGWKPAADLSFRLSYGYTDARFRRYDNGRADFKGRRVPYAPSNTLFVAADWRMPSLSFLGVVPSVSADVRGAGNIYWNEANTLSQPFYALASLSVAFTAEKWSLRLWARNLTDAGYDTFYFMSVGNEFTQKGRPRELGLTFRLNLDRD